MADLISSQSETESSDMGRSSMSDYESNFGSGQCKNKARRINKGRWTKEEDNKLKSVVELVGSDDWKQIASYFEDRTDHQCLHRWEKVLNPDLVKGAWTKDEDEKVVELVRKYGPKRWSTIAQQLPGRIGKQCRERWHNHLNPAIKKTAWTEEEDQIIYDAHLKMGNKWAEIAKMVPGRTDNAIKNHWNSTMKKRVETQGYEEYKENRYRNGKYNAKETRHKERRRVNWSHMHQTRSERLSRAEIVNSAPTMVARFIAKKEPVDKPTTTQETVPVATTKTANHSAKSSTPCSTSSQVTTTSDEMLSPLRTITDDLKELFDLEPNAWGELTSFESDTSLECSGKSPATNRWQSPGMIGCRFDGKAIASLQASKGSLIPITSPLVTNCFRTPPAILRKGKKRRRDDPNTTLNTTTSSSTSTTTPQCTPIKCLPFSPSQFFNSPITAKEAALLATSTPVCSRPSHTSTPVCARESLNTPKIADAGVSFRTPKIRRSLLNSPRTPTPFKEAMATFPSPSMQMAPHFGEDITDLVQNEEADAVQDLIPSLTTHCSQTFPANISGAFNTTASSKDTPSQLHTFPANISGAFNTTASSKDTPSQLHEELASGVMDTSYMSPLSSSAVKPNDVFGGGSSEHFTPSKPPTSPYFNNVNTPSLAQGLNCSPVLNVPNKISTPPNLFLFETPTGIRKPFYKSFQEVACGQTADQRFLTEQAKQFVYRQTARSLKFAPPSYETGVTVM